MKRRGRTIEIARAVAVAKARLRWQKLRDAVAADPNLSKKDAAKLIGLTESGVDNMVHLHTDSYKWPPRT